MSVPTLSNDELFAYRHSLEQGNSPHWWIEDADRVLAERGFKYADGSIVHVGEPAEGEEPFEDREAFEHRYGQ